MGDWTWLEGPVRTSPVSGEVLVDVLYEGEAGYRQVRADQVEWGRRNPSLVLWRVARQDDRAVVAGKVETVRPTS